MKEESKDKPKRSKKSSRVSKFKSTEARENYLAGLAYDAIEKKLKDGTASSQILCMLVGMKSEKARLENEKLKSDLDVANAKIENLKRQTSSEELMKRAIDAFKRYSGSDDDEYEEEDDDE